MSDNQKINLFFQRIEERLQQANTVPAEISHLIQQSDLKEIYEYMLVNRSYVEAKLAMGKPFRLDKTRTQLARTLNVIFHPQTHEPILILETKSKNALNQNDPNTKVFSGTFKSTKPAWRIDSSKPEKIANAVFYIEKLNIGSTEGLSESEIKRLAEELPAKQLHKIENGLKEAKKELNFSDLVAKSNPNDQINVNCPVLGQLIDKAGIRKTDSLEYVKKISFYSSWAEMGSLFYFLETPEGKSLTPVQLNTMAKQLVKGLIAIHKSGVIHQDIKPDNILVLKDGEKYCLKYADFGLSAEINDSKLSKKDALATIGYESPEISAANNKRMVVENGKSKEVVPFNHPYFYNIDIMSYGRTFGKDLEFKPEYAIPHEANDCWALGVVLHEIYKKVHPSLVDNQQNFSPLIAGLLQPNRANRFTADQALECIEQQEARERAQAEAFTFQNPVFHPGFKATRPKPVYSVPRKMSRCNRVLDWMNDCVKRSRLF